MMRSLLTCLFLIITLVACEQVTILQDLDQRDANEVMVVLSKHGIQAKKVTVTAQNRTSWAIQVSPEDEDRASQLLIEIGLPRQKELGLAGICQDPGMIPTPKMEKCQQLLALKGEIINALQAIPGVVRADVVLNIPDKVDFPDANAPVERPSASVVVQIRDAKTVGESFNEDKVRQFVSRTISGLDPRDVSVIISALVSPEDMEKEAALVEDALGGDDEMDMMDDQPDESMVNFLGMKMDPKSAKKVKFFAVIILAFAMFLSVVIIYLVVRMMRKKRVASTLHQPSSSQTAQIPEKASVDQMMDDVQGYEDNDG